MLFAFAYNNKNQHFINIKKKRIKTKYLQLYTLNKIINLVMFIKY